MSLIGIAVVYGHFSVAFADDSDEEKLRNALKVILPDVEVTSVSPSPVNGLYEIMLGPEVVYMTADGRYVMRGDLQSMRCRFPDPTGRIHDTPRILVHCKALCAEGRD